MENIENSIIEIEAALKIIDALFSRISGREGKMRFVFIEAQAKENVKAVHSGDVFRLVNKGAKRGKLYWDQDNERWDHEITKSTLFSNPATAVQEADRQGWGRANYEIEQGL